jgi:lysophospholipase L1-like esterase
VIHPFTGGRPVRLRRILSSLAVAAVTLAVAVPPTPVDAATPTAAHYYVALGDSLSRGYQPGAGDTDQGYADDAYATLHAKDPSLQLVKLGCSGETTQTMIDGGVCTNRYPAGSGQLAAAEQFLRAHAGSVSYVTLDIGANDVDGCAAGGSIDVGCALKGVAAIQQNLKTILAGLTAADARAPRSVGMTYYDPFLAAWLTGTQGKVVAIASVALLEVLNTVEVALFGRYGFHVADVATAFHSADFLTSRSVPGYGRLPNSVAYICQYTYMCSQQNIHPTVAGYRILAAAFAKQLARP